MTLLIPTFETKSKISGDFDQHSIQFSGSSKTSSNARTFQFRNGISISIVNLVLPFLNRPEISIMLLRHKDQNPNPNFSFQMQINGIG